jgi:hypothetical protein
LIQAKKAGFRNGETRKSGISFFNKGSWNTNLNSSMIICFSAGGIGEGGCVFLHFLNLLWFLSYESVTIKF